MSNPDSKGARQMGEFRTGPELGNITISQLAYLFNHPEHPMRQEVEHECNGRPNPAHPDSRIPCATKARFKCMAYFAEVTACDDCRNAAIHDENISKAKTYWESICPLNYRDTDKAHAGFPATIFKTLADFKGGESLFMYGPSRTGKSRCAVLLLKRCLLLNKHVGCLWPEELKHAAHSFNDRLKYLRQYARYDLLLLDDALLTGAQDEKIASFLKDLIDLLMRNKNHFIITSQIGGSDYKEQANKSDKTTKVDHDRIDALLGRIREVCRVIPFVTAQPADDSERLF